MYFPDVFIQSFDMMLPLEVDDEYWEMREGGPVFLQQPAGKPAIISAFIAQLKLSVTSEAATSRLVSRTLNHSVTCIQPFVSARSR